MSRVVSQHSTEKEMTDTGIDESVIEKLVYEVDKHTTRN